MPGYNHPGGLPPRPPTQEEIEAAQKKVVSADRRNAERLANVALMNTKKSLKAPAHKTQPAPVVQAQKFVAPKPASAKPAAAPPAPAAKPAQPAPPQMGDLPKDEGEEEVFTDDDEKTLLGEGESEGAGGDGDLEGDGSV